MNAASKVLPLWSAPFWPLLLLWTVVAKGIIMTGELSTMLFRIIIRFPLFFKNPALTISQMVSIGVSSIPLIFTTSIFVGMVTAVQAKYQFRGFAPDVFIGTLVCKSVILEFGPVITALVMAGRVGTALAAEVGSMKEKEELDAMVVLDLDPLRYIAMPRMLAFMVMMPALTIFAMFVDIIGGWVVGVINLDLSTYTYVTGLKTFFIMRELFVGIFKSFVFGVIICLLGYHHGVTAGAGAKGVGNATMKVVVSSSVMILIFDFLIAALLMR